MRTAGRRAASLHHSLLKHRIHLGRALRWLRGLSLQGCQLLLQGRDLSSCRRAGGLQHGALGLGRSAEGGKLCLHGRQLRRWEVERKDYRLQSTQSIWRLQSSPCAALLFVIKRSVHIPANALPAHLRGGGAEAGTQLVCSNAQLLGLRLCCCARLLKLARLCLQVAQHTLHLVCLGLHGYMGWQQTIRCERRAGNESRQRDMRPSTETIPALPRQPRTTSNRLHSHTPHPARRWRCWPRAGRC